MYAEKEGDVHGHHQEIAMASIDDAHYSKDQRHPDPKQAVEAAQENAARQHLDQDREWTFLHSLYARARLNGNLELSRR
jgi:hypothetical protein